MKLLTLTFRNIKKFILFHPVMFFFLIFAQIVCCIAVFITAGMAYNMDYAEKDEELYRWFGFAFDVPMGIGFDEEKKEDGTVVRKYTLTGQDGNDSDTLELTHAVPVGEFRGKMEEFISRTGKYDISSVSYEVYQSKVLIGSEMPMDYYQSIYPGLDSIYPIDARYIDSSERIILGPLYNNKGEISPFTPLRLGETITINHSEFKCVGNYAYNFIPYNALPDDFVIGVMKIRFRDLMTSEQINEVIGITNDIFGSDITETFPPDAYDPDNIKFTRMMYIISMAVMVIIMLAIAKYYSFILETRQGALAVLRLCGCSRGASYIIYISEMMISMLVTSAAGYLIFRFVLLSPISDLYPSFREFYMSSKYIYILLIYFIISLIFMTVTAVISAKSSIVRMMKEK